MSQQFRQLPAIKGWPMLALLSSVEPVRVLVLNAGVQQA